MTAFDMTSVEAANELADKLFEKGIFIRPLGKTVYLLPPYCISIDELEGVYREISDFLS